MSSHDKIDEAYCLLCDGSWDECVLCCGGFLLRQQGTLVPNNILNRPKTIVLYDLEPLQITPEIMEKNND
jgi:hypothetical protein